MEEKEVILTQEGFDNLEKELNYLRTEKRAEIADRIKVALGFGDLSENSEYDEAKTAQAENEVKIAELENKIRHAKIIDEKDIDKIKAYSAASDNIGNFFGQNVFMASSGVLLISGTLESLGYNVDTLQIAKASLPIALAAFALCILQNYLLDNSLKRKYNKK